MDLKNLCYGLKDGGQPSRSLTNTVILPLAACLGQPVNTCHTEQCFGNYITWKISYYKGHFQVIPKSLGYE